MSKVGEDEDMPEWMMGCELRIAAAVEAERQKWQAENESLRAELARERSDHDGTLAHVGAIKKAAVEAERKACEEIARSYIERGITTEADERAEQIADAIAARGKA